MDNHILFNCCPNEQAPDWKRFDALEIGGCIDELKDEDTDESRIIGCIERDEAEFFTIYGHIPGEGVEAITDCPSLAEAERIAAVLVQLSGQNFDINVYC